MTWYAIGEKFVADLKATGWPEFVSTVAQILSVWYARKNNILVYPTGLIGVLLAAYVYFFISDPPLYADGALNLYYFAMSVYGWYNWTQKSTHQSLLYPIRWCSKSERAGGVLLFLVSWFILYVFLTWFTDSNTTVLDSLVSAISITAMWWMAKRKIENWIAWILSNLVSIPLNFYKGMIFFTLMYILFTVLATWGLQDWKKLARTEKHSGTNKQ